MARSPRQQALYVESAAPVPSTWPSGTHPAARGIREKKLENRSVGDTTYKTGHSIAQTIWEGIF